MSKKQIVKILIIIVYALISMGLFFYFLENKLDIEALVTLGQLLIGLGIITLESRNEAKFESAFFEHKDVKSQSFFYILGGGLLILIGIFLIIATIVGNIQNGRKIDDAFIRFARVIIIFIFLFLIYTLEHPVFYEKIYAIRYKNKVSGICKRVVLKRYFRYSGEIREVVNKVAYRDLYWNRDTYYTYNLEIKTMNDNSQYIIEKDKLNYKSELLPKIGEKIELYINPNNDKQFCRVLSSKEKIFIHSLSPFIFLLGLFFI